MLCCTFSSSRQLTKLSSTRSCPLMPSLNTPPPTLERTTVRPEGEGNGNPLQYSCLENPVDIGAWCKNIHAKDKPAQPICPTPQQAAFPSDLLRPSPNYRGTSGFPASLWKTIFPQTRVGRVGFRIIQVHYIYCALYYYFISCTSDHQVSDPRDCGPLL